MRKFLKPILLTLLVTVLFCLLCVAISAAETTEGATDAYYRVVASDGAVIGYHNTLQSAIDAVTNGGTIYVEKDVPAETKVEIDASNGISFSIVGGTGEGTGATRKTITMTGGAAAGTAMSKVSSSLKMFLVTSGAAGVSNGSVTIQNVTFATSDIWYDFIHATGNGYDKATVASLIMLENVQAEFASCYGIWFHQTSDLHVKGADTRIINTSSTSTYANLLRTNTGAWNCEVTLEDGTYQGNMYLQARGMNLRVTDATITTLVDHAVQTFSAAAYSGYTATLTFEGNTSITPVAGKYVFHHAPGSGTGTGEMIVNIKGGTYTATGHVAYGGGDYDFYLTYNVSGGKMESTTSGIPLNLQVSHPKINISGGELYTGATSNKCEVIRTTGMTSCRGITISGGCLYHRGTTGEGDMYGCIIGVRGIFAEGAGVTVTGGNFYTETDVAGNTLIGVNSASTAPISITISNLNFVGYQLARVVKGTLDLTVNSGTFEIHAPASEGAFYVADGAAANVTINAATFKSSTVPNCNGVDTSKVDLVLMGDFSLDHIEVSTKATVADQSDMDALITAYYNSFAEGFKSVSYESGVSLDDFLGKWLTLVIKEGGDVTVSCGCSATDAAALFKVQGGTLTITGGVYSCGSATPIEISSGKVYVTGGKITTTATYAVNVTGKDCVIDFENATIETTESVFMLSSSSAGSVLTVKSGTYYGWRMIYIGDASTVNVQGGDFIANTTKEVYDSKEGKTYMINLTVGGAELNMTGGDFVGNEYVSYFLVFNSGAAATQRNVTLSGGSFTSAMRWIFINQAVDLVIDGASFSDPDGILLEEGAIRVRNNGSSGIVSVTVKSGAFYIPESTHSPLFWFEEGSISVLGGSFDIYRLAKIDHISGGTAGSLTVGGGTFKISSSKAIQAYHASKAKFDLTFNGGMFILPHEDAMLVNCADGIGAAYATLKSLTVNAVSVLAKSPTAILWDDVTINSIDPAKIKYAGEVYYTYFKSAATDESIDIATTDDAFKGASVMVTTTSDVNGIRFYTVIPDSVIATLKGMTYESISFGTIITPAEYVTAAGAFTIEALEKLSVKGDKYANIPTKYSMRDADGDGIPESYSAALINLKTVNYDRVFAAISYALIDGKYYYGSYNMTDNARSIEEVALEILRSSDYEAGQLDMLTAYAGFAPQAANVVTTTFTAGKVDVTGKKLVATDGYATSGVIHLEKKGSVLVVADKDGSFASSDTYVISRWTADGTALDEPYVAYDGTSSEIVTTVGSSRYYTYVSTYDNEYVRVSCKGNGTDIEISVREAGRRGTLMQNSAAYTTYVRDAYILDSIKETYHEELEGLHIVGIAPSTLDNKAIAGNLWIDLLADKYNMTLDNHSVSGSTIANDLRELPTNHSSYAVGSTRAVNSFVERLSNPNAKKGFSQTPNPDVDIVFICGGGNDLTRGIGIGEISLDNTDTATLCGAINFCIAKIKELFPNALILSETTTPSSLSYTFDYNEGEEPFTMTRVEYYQKVKEIMAMHGIVSFDFLDESLTGTNIASEAFREQYYMDPDDVKHMNVEGMKMWMPLEEAFIAGEYKKFLATK